MDKIFALGRIRCAEFELSEGVSKALENNHATARACLEQAKKDIELALRELTE